jgi:HEAT repeat protein
MPALRLLVRTALPAIVLALGSLPAPAEAPTPADVPALLRRLNDPSAAERRAAAEALGQVKLSADQVPRVLLVLAEQVRVEEDGPARRAMLAALMPLATPAHQPALARLAPLLGSKDEVTRRRAAAVLALAGGEQARRSAPVLVRALEDTEAEQAKAIRDLELAKAAEAAALRALEQAKAARAELALAVKGAKAAQAEVALALSKVGPDAAAASPALARLVEHSPDPLLRVNAALALGAIGEPAKGAAAALGRALAPRPKSSAHPTDEDRIQAAGALARIRYPGNAPALPALRRAIEKETNPKLRQRCIWAVFSVADLKKEGLLGPLEKALDAKGPENKLVRYDAARALAVSLRAEAPDRAVDALLAMLQDRTLLIYTTKGRPADDARFLAAEALSLLGPRAGRRPDVVRALRAAAADGTSPALREAAKRALRVLELKE